MEHDVAKLESRLRAHDKRLRSFESLSELLLPIIHRPGFTSPAEWAFVDLAVEALVRQVETLASIQSRLVEAAQRVA